MTLTEIIELTDALTNELVPIAHDAPDVCSICRSGKSPFAAICKGCAVTTSQIDAPCERIIPISYYTTPSPLRDRMHDYKEHEDPTVRHHESLVVAGILTRYLIEHDDRLRERFGAYSEIVTVPSTKNPPSSALAAALRQHYQEHLPTVTDRLSLGTGSMGFQQASPTGFVPDPQVESSTVLLLDDTFTTGARTQSAAHALQSVGAHITATVVVCRKINPNPRYFTDQLWQRQVQIPFSFKDLPWWAQ